MKSGKEQSDLDKFGFNKSKEQCLYCEGKSLVKERETKIEIRYKCLGCGAYQRRLNNE